MKQTYDINVKEFKPLISPASIKIELPITDDVAKTVIDGRRDVENILLEKRWPAPCDCRAMLNS